MRAACAQSRRATSGPPLPLCLRAQIVQVDAEQLEAEILSRDRPLIIDFYATWCGPCVLLAKELETVSGGWVWLWVCERAGGWHP